MAMVALTLSHFCRLIIRHVRANRPLDDEALEAMKLEAVTELKNSDASGMSLEVEAQAFRKAIDNFLNLAGIAMADTTKP
jgi:hypothetical protein